MFQSLSLIDSLSSLKEALSSGDPLSRLQALELCRKFQAELETPAETVFKVTWSEVGTRLETIVSLIVNVSQPTIGLSMLHMI